jgi:outer membrane receptor protein involved in Fe transport
MLRRILFVLCSTAFVGHSLLFAQTATISGTVSDQSGALIPGAQATVANTETGGQRVADTNERGRFTVPQLPPGRYQVTVVKEGFETLVRSGITLAVGQAANLNLALTVGAVNQQVTVSAEAPLVDTSNSSVSGVIEERRIQELPLNGRDFSQLALVEAGVQAARTTNSSVQKGFGERIVIAGSKADQTGWLLDGTNIKSMSNFGTPGSASGLLLGVDAVREFQVLTSSYSAEYGGGSGGVISMVVKSGTNELHGTVFEFHRNDDLDARNYFDVGKPPFVRNQFGFSLGGPIRRNKTFFFGNYESLRAREAFTEFVNVPDENIHRGLIPNASGGFTQVQIASSIMPYLPLWVLPNRGLILDSRTGFPTGRGEYMTVTSSQVNQNYFVTRADHRLGDNQSLFSRFTFDQGDDQRPNSASWISERIAETRTRYATVQYERIITPRFLATSRVAYNRTDLGEHSVLVTDYPESLRIFNNKAPSLGYPDVTALGPGDGFRNVQNLYQGQQNFVHTGGNNTVKFGVDYQKVGLNTDGGPRDFGSFTWDNVQTFLEDRVLSGFDMRAPGSSAQRTFVQHVVGLYVQDDWRWRPNFTWNLGLRYEPFTTPAEKHDRISVVKDWVTATEFDTGVPFWDNSSGKNFSPRVGFAWDPRGDGKTAVRGGFGMFYQVYLGSYYRTPAVKNPPFAAQFEQGIPTWNLAGAVGAVNRLAPLLLSKTMNPEGFMETLQWDIDPAYEVKFNFTVERELPGNMSASAGYIGGRGNHLWRSAFTNIAVPVNINGRLTAIPGTLRPNRNIGEGTHRYSDVKSFYNALLLSVKKRFSRGFLFQTSYTLSKNIDDSTSGVGNTDYGDQRRTLYAYVDTKGDRGLSGLHQGQSLTINGVWALPSPASSGIASYILGGWQASGIFTASDGNPFYVGSSGRQVPTIFGASAQVRPDWIGGDRAFSSAINPGDTEHYFDTSVFGIPAVNTLGNAGRNILIGPGHLNFDLNLVKNIPLPIKEGSRLEFTGGFFNLFNNPSFGQPSSAVWNGTNGRPVPEAGRIRSVKNRARQIQLGLKLTF